MRTDASGRFEKGLDPMNTVPAVERACELLELLGAGEVLDGVIDVVAVAPKEVRLPLEPERINALLGMSADYVAFKERENVELGYGKVNASSVNMRAKPSSDGDLIQQIPYGEKAYIIGLNCGWYKVKYNGNTGYIRSDLLELTEKPVYNSSSSSYVSMVS